MTRWTVVHGRFQPFHLGHLEYLGLAVERGGHVLVGITNPALGRLAVEHTSGHRHRKDANPYTYFERAEMITGSLPEVPGATAAAVRIVPFDVSDPAVWDDYLPRGALHLVTLNEPWDQEKYERFRAAGYAVEAVPGNPHRVTATEVRRRMAHGEDWRALVPRGTARVIDGLPTPREFPRTPLYRPESTEAP
ncbi:adenylyltransferase/cytidyltransferase family protein [Streptomyces sp. NPDC047803]|uniref:adenylyltransferase/cytidyltransferase family protein n=1 Tax=unclassified Streptomyces TaxID=2593676 RepID=UPI0034066B59